MKAELQLKKVKAAFKALHNDYQGSILTEILQMAMTTGTPWTDEINEHIGNVCGPGKWLGNYTARDEL